MRCFCRSSDILEENVVQIMMYFAVGVFLDGIKNLSVCYCNEQPFLSLIVLMTVDRGKINRDAWAL